MKAEIFEIPQCFNMGFHYTIQFSRRTRVCVMGLVDQSSEEWERWYLRMHEKEALREIADAGYTIIEIHFLYGFGLKSEKEEWERTRIMVQNAHEVGLRVFGYFQFFSVQEETFFLENPWAKKCVQIDAKGNRIQYRYDRPALCFSNAKVRQYYLDGIELGLKTCDLDGIRLDNDYYRGCYCERCQAAFRTWLTETFDKASAKRIFGLSSLKGMSLVPVLDNHDPLWLATVKFRQKQRQDIMLTLSEKIHEIKPQAIFGGNPAISRRFNDTYRINVYPPDLGKTHHLVCAENLRFPARTGESTRHQAVLYKYGQSSNYSIFVSHHLYRNDGSMRWPDSVEECLLSFCEGLAFGGHPVTTTWGLRMDGNENHTLYQRPIFLQALDIVSKFIKNNSDI
ncbi:MAG TPA: beta-galactosidase, partial [Phycisphaerae bacterium]|nr:beta-galactosidase [Phycisphaerae bacterium]